MQPRQKRSGGEPPESNRGCDATSAKKRSGVEAISTCYLVSGGKIMVKHIILWQLKDELSAQEKELVKKEIKAGLEDLQGKVPGLLDIHVQISALDSSNADLMLDVTLEDAAALKGYAVHPDHLAVANSKVRPYTKTRICMDFQI